MMGIPGNSPLVILLISGSVLLVVFFRFSVIVSDLKDDNIAIAQRLAILEYQTAIPQPAIKVTEEAKGPRARRHAPSRQP